MNITLKHVGAALTSAGIAIGIVLATKAHTGYTPTAGFILWIAAAATLSACGTILCVGHHIAARVEARVSQSYWTQMADRFRADTTADVHHLDTARTSRTSRAAG